MLAAVLRDFGDLELTEVPEPEAKDNGTVVVQIRSCGICATDYKAIKGIRRNVSFPFIPGHEPSGRWGFIVSYWLIAFSAAYLYNPT